uniref:Glycoside hydrolase family 28 protein n=1 Tax=Acidobacterium capsulatum TaxID=33075 RepID=A0A7V4XTZ4_9BACT
MQNRLLALFMAAAGIASLLAAPSAHAASGMTTCNPRSYGAKGNGVAKDTAAIQHAIDACAKRGGGTVLLTPGTYLSAPIVLKSNITLRLEKGGTLLGSPDFNDYPAITEFRAPGRQSLISAKDASNITIEGAGTINGNGAAWWKMAREHKDTGVMGSRYTRPRLIVFNHCKHVVLEGVTVENSPMWQIVPYYSDDVTIRNIHVLAPQHAPNTDAIDPFSSSHVLIEHVVANVGDDDIAIKSGEANSQGPDAPSTYITIRDCIFLHGHGLSVGSEIAGGAQHILAENITMTSTDNGIRVKANRDRGNDVSDLVFKNIQMKNVKNALIISEFYPHIYPPMPDNPAPITRLTPHFHNITVENVTATGSKNAGAIAGLPEAPIRDVVLRNVSIDAQKGMVISNAQVTATHFTVHSEKGPGITRLSGARLILH